MRVIMDDNLKLEEAFNSIRKIVDAAFANGERAALQRVFATVQSNLGVAISNNPSSYNPISDNDIKEVRTFQRQRAPRGSVEKVIARAFDNDIIDNGITINEVMLERETEEEKMIAESSVRGRLREGQRSGIYVEEGGRWKKATLQN
jgi:hypothetical protein